MPQYTICHSWTEAIPEERVLEACLEITQRHEPRGHAPIQRSGHNRLADVLAHRLNLKMMAAPQDTFIDISTDFARHYLRLRLTRGQAQDTPLLSPDAAQAISQEVFDIVPDDAHWLCNEHTSEDFNSPDELPPDQSWGCLISQHRAFEFCLAALWDNQAFVFYIWDEE